MSKRNKLQKFEDLRTFHNVWESYDFNSPTLRNHKDELIAPLGKWNKLFAKDQPLTLELACGKGHYTLGLAQRFPDQNFLGVDIKGARLWRGAKDAIEGKISNAGFLRVDIMTMKRFFDRNEVSEIWITFPDPFLAKPNRRTTNPKFLDIYKEILVPGGLINLKTDSDELYEYTKEVLNEYPGVKINIDNNDIYASALPVEALNIKTEYEGKHLKAGKTIKYLQFTIS